MVISVGMLLSEALVGFLAGKAGLGILEGRRNVRLLSVFLSITTTISCSLSCWP